MRDGELVASITAGDPLGLAAAYDKYSGPLFGYCQTLLDEPADAADAVQDTFVIAASKLSTLRDPERLRAWLFAVARNECLHRLKSRRATAPLAVAADRADDSADVSDEAERAEARELIRAAVGGLNAGERDVINQLWHGLEVPEVAAVLGLSRNHVYSLFSRARDQLEASVGVLLVGRAGRKDCAALDRLLIGWDGQLTAALRKRVGRHINRCPVCSDRRRKVLTPALLFDLAPAAVLALAVVRRAGPLASVGHLAPGAHLAALPTGVRGEMLRLATSPAPHAAAYRAGVARSTGPFHTNGFPRAAHTGHLALSRVAHLQVAMAGGTAATATVTVAATATAVVTAVVPNVHMPSLAGRGGASAPSQAHTSSHVASRTPSTTASPPPIRLVASTAPTTPAATPAATAKGKKHAHKAKKAGNPKTGKSDGSSDRSGDGNGDGNSQGNGNHGNGDHGNGNRGNGNGNGDHGNGNGNHGNGNSGSTPSPSPTVTVSATPTAGTPSGAMLAVSLVPGPSHGSLTLTANGRPVALSVVYVRPAAACERPGPGPLV